MGPVAPISQPGVAQVPRPALAPNHAIQPSLLSQRLVLTSQAQARLPSKWPPLLSISPPLMAQQNSLLLRGIYLGRCWYVSSVKKQNNQSKTCNGVVISKGNIICTSIWSPWVSNHHIAISAASPQPLCSPVSFSKPACTLWTPMYVVPHITTLFNFGNVNPLLYLSGFFFPNLLIFFISPASEEIPRLWLLLFLLLIL